MHADSSKILWVAPNFNHYKQRFLQYLSEQTCHDIIVLAGKSPENDGYQDAPEMEFLSEVITLPTTKYRIGLI